MPPVDWGKSRGGPPSSPSRYCLRAPARPRRCPALPQAPLLPVPNPCGPPLPACHLQALAQLLLPMLVQVLLPDLPDRVRAPMPSRRSIRLLQFNGLHALRIVHFDSFKQYAKAPSNMFFPQTE